MVLPRLGGHGRRRIPGEGVDSNFPAKRVVFVEHDAERAAAPLAHLGLAAGLGAESISVSHGFGKLHVDVFSRPY